MQRIITAPSPSAPITHASKELQLLYCNVTPLHSIRVSSYLANSGPTSVLSIEHEMFNIDTCPSLQFLKLCKGIEK
jgi:hypothetical protein